MIPKRIISLIFTLSKGLALLGYMFYKFIRIFFFFCLVIIPFLVLQLLLIIILSIHDFFFIFQNKNIPPHPEIKEENGTVAVIIPNYNGEYFLDKLLDSLMKQTYPTLKIYVIDNCSIDNSRRIVEKYPRVTWIKNEENLGFSGAINRGVKEAKGCEYYTLLNNDTIVEPTWAEELVKAMRSDPELGAVGSLIFLAGMPNTLNLYATFLGNDLRTYNIGVTSPYKPENYSSYQYVLSASACSIMYRAIAFHDTGYYDERYFLCYEDFDFNLRMFWKGWKIKIVDSSRVFHISNASMETGSKIHVYYLCRNDLFPFIKLIPSSFMIKNLIDVIVGSVNNVELRLFFKWQGFRVVLFRFAMLKYIIPLLKERRLVLSHRRREISDLAKFMIPSQNLSIRETYRLDTGETYLKNIFNNSQPIKGVYVNLEISGYRGISFPDKIETGEATSTDTDPHVYLNKNLTKNSIPEKILFDLFCNTVSWGQIMFTQNDSKGEKVILCSNHFRVYAGWNTYAFNIDSGFWNREIVIPDIFGMWKNMFNTIRIDMCEIENVKIGIRNVFLLYPK
jgi:GT2 family glycosyltransferase